MTWNQKWHPCLHFFAHYPHLRIDLVDLEPLGLVGRVTAWGVELHRYSSQDERRSTLTHEIIHLERGTPPNDPYYAAREERVVEELTARRLIALHDLVDAALWCQCRITDEAAEELGVDRGVLEDRIRTLTPGERDWVEYQIADRLPA